MGVRVLSGDRISVRDKYERDEKGRLKTEAEEKNKKELGKKKSKRGSKGGKGEKKGSGCLGFIVAIFLIGAIVFAIKESEIIDFRTWNSTSEENFLTFKNVLDKYSHKSKSGEYDDDFYDKNRLYTDEVVNKQVEKEYVVYVYSPNEGDNTEFDKWVESETGKFKIYKLHAGDVVGNKDILEYHSKFEPAVYIFNEVDRGDKELDGVIKDPELLNKVSERIEELKEEKKQEKEKE